MKGGGGNGVRGRCLPRAGKDRSEGRDCRGRRERQPRWRQEHLARGSIAAPVPAQGNGANPRRGIKRYRRKGRECFVSDEEICRLSARLKAHESRRAQRVTVIRLLLLTGCCKGKILTLKRSGTAP